MIGTPEQLATGQRLEEASLSGFLVTWANVSDPEIYQQVLKMWSEQALAFGPSLADRKVRPGIPPQYPGRR